jgi:hypothetical protein
MQEPSCESIVLGGLLLGKGDDVVVDACWQGLLLVVVMRGSRGREVRAVVLMVLRAILVNIFMVNVVALLM